VVKPNKPVTNRCFSNTLQDKNWSISLSRLFLSNYLTPPCLLADYIAFLVRFKKIFTIAKTILKP
jgi:hypothetical protein